MKLLILSDIHDNWLALQAIVQAEPDRDTVAYCGDGGDHGLNRVECILWLAGNADYAVRGNHDNALAEGQDCHCMWSFRAASLATRDWHRTLVSGADRDYLLGL